MRLLGAILWQRNAGLGGLFALTAAGCVLYAVLFPGILSVAALGRFGQSWLPLALVATAQTVVMLTGGIDLAVGAMVGLGSVVAATTMGSGILPGVAATLGLGAASGATVGAVITAVRLPAIVVTLATSFILGGFALVILPRPGGMVPQGLSDALAGHAPVALLIVCALPLLWRVFLLTPPGAGLIALGDNPVGAWRSGVDTAAVRITAFALSGMLQAAAGLYVAAQTGSGDPVIGAPFTLNSIAAAVLGGVGFAGGQGTLRGALAGSLLLTVLIAVMFFLRLPPVTQYVVQGAVIIAAVGLPLLARR